MLPAIVARVMSARGPALVPAEGVHGVARLADAAPDAARPAIVDRRQVSTPIPDRPGSGVSLVAARGPAGTSAEVANVTRAPVERRIDTVHAPERQKTEDHRAHGRKRSRRAR